MAGGLKVSITEAISGTQSRTWTIVSGDSDGPSDLRISGSTQVQRVAGLRWEKSKTFGRENKTVDVSFTIWKLHADHATAMGYALTFSNRIPRDGNVLLEIGSYRLYLLDAAIEVIESNVLGKSSFHTMRIIGAAVTT